MAEKKVRRIQTKTLLLVIGLTLCLFAVVLVINVGYFARALAFPFLYFLGIGSYIFYYWIFYTNGILILFRGKGLKVDLKFLIGNLTMFIGFSMLFTLIQTKELPVDMNFVARYNEIYNGTGVNQMCNGLDAGKIGYFEVNFINVFSQYNVGGGLLGYALVGVVNSYVNVTVSWVIAIALLIITYFLLFLKPTIAFGKWVMNKFKSSESTPVKESVEQEPARQIITKKDIFVTSQRQIINEARQIDSNYESEVIGVPNLGSEITTANFNNRSNFQTAETTGTQINFSSNQAFRPARFTRSSIEVPSDHQVSNESIFVKEPEPVLPPQKKETPDFDTDDLIGPPIPEEPSSEEFIPTPIPVTSNNTKIEVAAEIKPAPVVKKPFKWVAPSSDILQEVKSSEASERNNAVAEERMVIINETFKDFGVGASCCDYTVGPSVTRFKIQYDHNVSVKSVSSLIQDISIRLEGVAARFESVVEGLKYSSLEVPNAVVTPVSFKEVYEALPDVKQKPLAVAFGKNIEGKVICAELDQFPHLLVAGTTGSGKSVFTHSVISTLIMRNSPETLKLVLIDPKKVELVTYKDIAHLLCPVISKPKEGKNALVRLAKLMDERYEIYENIPGIRSIKDYNEYAEENKLPKMPYIVCVIDEYADLVDNCKDVSLPVVSLVQKARTAGIHLIIATQRPSTNVITGVIKGNLPTRIALSVASAVDSNVILGEGGAEKLLGKGDMLVSTPLISRVGNVRLQSCFITSKDLSNIVGYLKYRYQPEYDEKFMNLDKDDEVQEDPSSTAFVENGEYSFNAEDEVESKYQYVKEWVMSNKYMSLSRIQRECSVGFNRAGRFFKRLQDEGIVAKQPEGNRGCPVLVTEDNNDSIGGSGDEN